MINTKTIEKAIYNLCIEANTVLSDITVEQILTALNEEKLAEEKQALQLILKNAKMSYDSKKPLCQDTGQVLVFVKIGQNARIEGDNLNNAINNGVIRAYEENYYRKSVVKNAIFDRTNTNNNTPCIIYTEIIGGENIELELLIKGAGSENKSVTTMLSPTSSQDEIIDFVVDSVKKAGTMDCPPLFLGIGIGGTMEYAGLLSKNALLLEQNKDNNHIELAQKIKEKVNALKIGATGNGGEHTVLDIKILTDSTHIASMPVALTINCHSLRHAKCIIKDDEITYFEQKLLKDYTPEEVDFSDYKKLKTSDINELKTLKNGDKVLLSGEIYTARDMAHKRLVEMIENNQDLPFDIENKIIFYAGPCPCTECEVVGSIGPTTSSRMDKYAEILYKKGLLATIGKGERSADVKRTIKEVGGLYFTVLGGVACYLSGRFIKKDLVAFEDLGTEAIYRFEVLDLPLVVECC